MAELGMSRIENPGEIETRLLNNCKAELEDAKRDAEAQAEADVEDEDEVVDDSEGEVVWDADREYKGKKEGAENEEEDDESKKEEDNTRKEEDKGSASQSTEAKGP